MSAVNRPNMNFDNEIMVHTPYSVIASGSMQSAIEKFRRPKKLTETKKKKVKKEKSIEKDTRAFKKWFI